MERAPTRLRATLTNRGRQCPGFDGKSMAAGGAATAGPGGALPGPATNCPRVQMGSACKSRHRHSAIVVRSRCHRNARDDLLEDGAHVRYSEDYGSERLRPRVPC